MGYEVVKSMAIRHRGLVVKDCELENAWRVVLAMGSTL